MCKKIHLLTAIVFQCLIIAAVPAPKLFTRLTGKTITIKTAPVDPYDFMSGYHVVLSFEISRPSGTDSQVAMHSREDQIAYTVLVKGDDNVWKSKSVSNSFPEDIPDDAVVIKGKWKGSRIQYGIEKFFIPEEERREIERDLSRNRRQALADIRVDRFGNAALLCLRIEDRVYEY